MWPTLAFLITHEVLLWFVQRAVEGRPSVDPAELAAAEQRAIEAESAVAQAEQQAEQARSEAAERITKEQQAAEQQVEQVREQMRTETRGRDATIEQLHDELTQLRAAEHERNVDLQLLRSQLDDVEQAADSTARSPEDYQWLRQHIAEHVRQRRAEGEQGSLTTEVRRQFQVSPRWVQTHVPEATARAVREDAEDPLQLVGTR